MYWRRCDLKMLEKLMNALTHIGVDCFHVLRLLFIKWHLNTCAQIRFTTSCSPIYFAFAKCLIYSYFLGLFPVRFVHFPFVLAYLFHRVHIDASLFHTI